MSKLAGTLARVLAEALLAGRRPAGEHFPEGCDETTCFLRLNRYPPCPVSPDAFGLVPHTDSDFLTVLCQDHVGGLQLMKGARWVAVKPIPGALIVNIGDLFQVHTHHVALFPFCTCRSVDDVVLPSQVPSKACLATVLCARKARITSGTRFSFLFTSGCLSACKYRIQHEHIPLTLQT